MCDSVDHSFTLDVDKTETQLLCAQDTGVFSTLIHVGLVCVQASTAVCSATLFHLVSLRNTLPLLSLTRQQCRLERYGLLGRDRSQSAETQYAMKLSM